MSSKLRPQVSAALRAAPAWPVGQGEGQREEVSVGVRVRGGGQREGAGEVAAKEPRSGAAAAAGQRGDCRRQGGRRRDRQTRRGRSQQEDRGNPVLLAFSNFIAFYQYVADFFLISADDILIRVK